MPHIHIDHLHGLSLQEAQVLANDWAQAAQRDWAMEVHAAGDPSLPEAEKVWQFSRSGADGTLRVTLDRFVLEVRLGFLLGTFKERIEAQLLNNLRERSKL